MYVTSYSLCKIHQNGLNLILYVELLFRFIFLVFSLNQPITLDIILFCHTIHVFFISVLIGLVCKGNVTFICKTSFLISSFNRKCIIRRLCTPDTEYNWCFMIYEFIIGEGTRYSEE